LANWGLSSFSDRKSAASLKVNLNKSMNSIAQVRSGLRRYDGTDVASLTRKPVRQAKAQERTATAKMLCCPRPKLKHGAYPGKSPEKTRKRKTSTSTPPKELSSKHLKHKKKTCSSVARQFPLHVVP